MDDRVERELRIKIRDLTDELDEYKRQGRRGLDDDETRERHSRARHALGIDQNAVRVLLAILDAGGSVVKRERLVELSRRLAGRKDYSSDAVPVYIHMIRRRLGPELREAILSEWGVGYRANRELLPRLREKIGEGPC